VARRQTKRAELAQVQQWLSSWREEYGGRGRPIPEDLWGAAVEVAATQGVLCTARKLGLDRGRLEQRMAREEAKVAASQQQSAVAAPKFVELSPLGSSPFVAHTQVVVHVTGQDGKGLRMSIQGSASDVAVVVREFWGHAQ
jgi:hypothetical protein